MTRCFHFGPDVDAVCVRGTSNVHYATRAMEEKGDAARRDGRTHQCQRYGERMTVRPAWKCKERRG